MISSQFIEKLEIIGNGSFGRVFKCRDLRNGEFFAIKEIDLDTGDGDDCFDELRAEISTLMTCDHPNIIRYRASYVPNNNKSKRITDSPLSNRLCLVMDYCEGGSLRQILDYHGPLPEKLIADIASSILKALEYLHNQGISHRDLKGANVLVDSKGNVKLGDFGVAFQPEGQQEENRLVGSPYWMAPEVLNPSNTEQCNTSTSKADIWSFGITLIELLRGRPPLYYLSPRAAMEMIPRTSPPRLESDDPRASKMLRELIHSCLHDDPKKRPSATQLLKSFKYYFKQQKSITIPGSLAKLNDKFAKQSGDVYPSPPITTMSINNETIYSQWDFDMSTFKENTGPLEIKVAEVTDLPVIVDELELEEDPYQESDIVGDDKDPITIIEQCQNHESKLKFRKLIITNPLKELNRRGWDNKDISILPIPCPSDAPDLYVRSQQ